MKCTLCENSILHAIAPEKDKRRYFYCSNCSLIFTNKLFLPAIKEELDLYLLHNNSIEEPGYVNFLNRVIEPALPFFTPGMVGLDYGCGPGPTLSEIVAQSGFRCFNYDPIFDFSHPFLKYDFIFSTECFEHFHHPGIEIQVIYDLLKPGGYLCIMTERWESLEIFENWYYKIDPTHVSFFHKKTFDYIKEKYGFKELYSDHNRVIILQKEL